MTPPASEVASLDKDRGSDARSIIHGKTLNVENSSLHIIFVNRQLKIVDNLQCDTLLWFCQLKIVDNLQNFLLLPKISTKQMLTG
jgi:hypothetical protein